MAAIGFNGEQKSQPDGMKAGHFPHNFSPHFFLAERNCFFFFLVCFVGCASLRTEAPQPITALAAELRVTCGGSRRDSLHCNPWLRRKN